MEGDLRPPALLAVCKPALVGSMLNNRTCQALDGAQVVEIAFVPLARHGRDLRWVERQGARTCRDEAAGLAARVSEESRRVHPIPHNRAVKARQADLYWAAGGFFVAGTNALEAGTGLKGLLWALAALAMLGGFVATAVRLGRKRNSQRELNPGR